MAFDDVEAFLHDFDFTTIIDKFSALFENKKTAKRLQNRQKLFILKSDLPAYQSLARTVCTRLTNCTSRVTFVKSWRTDWPVFASQQRTSGRRSLCSCLSLRTCSDHIFTTSLINRLDYIWHWNFRKVPKWTIFSIFKQAISSDFHRQTDILLVD